MATNDSSYDTTLLRQPGSGLRGVALLGLATVALTACDSAESPVEVDTTPLPGAIAVATVTTGFLQDDGYELFIDGVSQGTIGANDQVTLADLEPATYELTLGDVADNCTVSAASVTVTAEATVDGVLAVACAAEASEPMTIRASRDRPDLDTGAVVQCNFGLCPSDTDWDLFVEFDSQSDPQSVIRQNLSAGVEIAHVVGVALGDLTEDDVAAASFTAEFEDRAFSSSSTVLVRTTSGAVYALGNPVEDTLLLTLTFDAVRIANGAS